MTTPQPILEQYSNGDDAHRIFMFLEHRDLRREFTRIEMGLSRSSKRQSRPDNNQDRLKQMP